MAPRGKPGSGSTARSSTRANQRAAGATQGVRGSASDRPAEPEGEAPSAERQTPVEEQVSAESSALMGRSQVAPSVESHLRTRDGGSPQFDEQDDGSVILTEALYVEAPLANIKSRTSKRLVGGRGVRLPRSQAVRLGLVSDSSKADKPKRSEAK